MCTIQWKIILGLFWQIATAVRRRRSAFHVHRKKTIQIVKMWHMLGSLPNKHLENRIWKTSGHVCSTIVVHYDAGVPNIVHTVSCDLGVALQFWLIVQTYNIWSYCEAFLCSVSFARWTALNVILIMSLFYFLHLCAFCDPPQYIQPPAARSGSSYISEKLHVENGVKSFFFGRLPLHTKQQVSGTETGAEQVIGWHVFRAQKMFPFWGEKKEREEKMSYCFFSIFPSMLPRGSTIKHSKVSAGFSRTYKRITFRWLWILENTQHNHKVFLSTKFQENPSKK